jgi:hypothetical protein
LREIPAFWTIIIIGMLIAIHGRRRVKNSSDDII